MASIRRAGRANSASIRLGGQELIEKRLGFRRNGVEACQERAVFGVHFAGRYRRLIVVAEVLYQVLHLGDKGAVGLVTPPRG